MINLYDTVDMLSALDQMKPAQSFLRNLFFNDVTQHDTKKVVIDVFKGQRRVAKFNNRANPASLVEKIGYSTEEYEPGYISHKIITRATDFLKRADGEVLFSDLTPEQRAARQLGRELSELRNMITRREEVMAASLLNDGTVTIAGEGVSRVINFNMPATHKITLSGTNLWNDAASDPIQLMREWRRLGAKDSGLALNAALMGSEALDAFLSNDNVREYLDNRRQQFGEIKINVRGDQSVSYGNIEGLEIFGYDEWYKDDAGVEQPMIPPKKVFLGATNAYTGVHYGAIEVDDGGMAGVPMFVDSWVKKDPNRRFLRAQSAPLVAMHQSDAFLSVQVLA